MKIWEIENNLIAFNYENAKIYPNAKELYNINKKYNYKNKEYNSPFDELNIKKSKIGLKTIIAFEYINNKISIILYAINKGKKYKVEKINNNFSDYIIIENIWYYLTINYIHYSEIINNFQININKNLTFNQYMSIIRKLKNENYDFIDDALKKIELIKQTNTTFKVNGLNATLYNYQDVGCRWLEFMMDNDCGCILGDEMGLGKTLQVIALLGKEKEKKKNSHFLVICPVSLIENWKREINKFFPSLNIYIHHGSFRTGLYTKFLNYDIIIMSYSNVQTDLSILNMINWDIVVIDEAQNIKNPYAKRTKSIKMLKRKKSIAITGTPFENHMTDIWSIVDFIFPKYLGNISQYENEFKDNIDSASKLEKFITPIMIRRKVKEVANDLPKRIDISQAIEMTENEALLYENERTNKVLKDLKSTKIEKIQELRMFCTHPILYDKTLNDLDPIKFSNKYSRLCEILGEIFENKEKAIIFTSFNKMIELIVKDINLRFNVYTDYINGSVDAKERQQKIDLFAKQTGMGILVLNPRAAGTGLNITCANHVIHYNLEWNPAIEDQASARVYRRGQNKKVFIYRLFYANTIEEIINERIQNKRNISNIAIIGNHGDEQEKADLLKALSISPIGGKNGNN